MSWSSSAYPAPRRSRSRSPYRGSHPSRNYPEYPADPYRAEWDAYDRERWAYERERAAYDYGRRGRSRSPPPEEVSRKRRRSASPYDRDRYEPRPRYADDYDAHSRPYGGYSPRRSGVYPQPGRRPPPDPHTFEYPATLKAYAEWFRYYYPQQAIDEDNADKAAEQEAGDGSRPRNGIRARWEKYKKEFAASQLQTMFDHHRKSPWFAEKYDPSPEFVNLRKRVRKDGWKGRMNTFLDDLEAGRFDPDLSEPMPEPTSPLKEDVKMEDGAITKEEKEGIDADSKELPPSGDDVKVEDDVVIDVEDEGGDNEGGKAEMNGKGTLDGRRSNRGEEISVSPEGNQVMIRTIPPDIGRVKLETALHKIPGYVYLALGDPLQKRNYYRAGWLKFREDVDMSVVMSDLNEKKIEGFKLHVIHNVAPFKNRVRYTPEVASKPDRLEKDLESAKALASLLETEYFTLRKTKFRLKVENGVTGEGEANGNVEQDLTMDENEVVDDEADDPEPREKGTDAIERRIDQLLVDLKESGLFDVDDEREMHRRKTELSLDLYLVYLRAVFHTCYYCAVITDHLEELQRKCIKHVRKPLSKAMMDEVKAAEVEKAEKESAVTAEEQDIDKEKEKGSPTKDKSGEGRDWKRNDERWLDWLDSKIALLTNRDGVDPRIYGGKGYDEELAKAVEPFIKQEDEGKFRCKTCQKLFKATSFVEKHIANKHAELVKGLDDIPYFNNFALDPHHIQPFSHPPPATGNNQAPPPQAYGLPGPVTYPPPGDFGRGAPYYGGYGDRHVYPPPPPYAGGVYWDPYAYPYTPGIYPPRRDEGTAAKRLSDRISGYAPGYDPSSEPTTVPASAGLPPKPAVTLEAAPAEETRGRRGISRRGGRGGDVGGPPPPPPPDAKEDPRAAAGKKVSYHDMDLVAEGDVELQY